MSEVFRDGFGIRTLNVDHVGDVAEVLTFAQPLAAIPEFAAAVGERVARLARVRHTFYARARRLDRTSENELLLFSDRAIGWRLADVLNIAASENLALDISTVLALLRQLLPGVALFSRHQRDATIGTIGPERLILTPQGRLVVAEYVLAPGVEKLQYSRERLWRELRVALPLLSSPSRIPPSADVVGIGVVALSLLLGRMLTEDEFLLSLPERVEGLIETSGGTTRPLPAGFAAWLGRTLQLNEGTGFQSTQEAQISFEEMLAKEPAYVTSPAQLDLFIARFERIAGPPPAPPVPSPRIYSITPPVVEAHAPAEPVATASEPEPQSAPEPEPQTTSTESEPPAVSTEPEPMVASETPAAEPDVPIDVGAGGKRWATSAFAAVTAVAVIEAAVIGWLLTNAGATALTPGQIVIRSQPVGARVVIDDEDRGATPLTTTISPGVHTIGIRAGKAERFLPVAIEAGAQTEMYIELPNVPTADAPTAKSGAKR